MDRMIVYPGAIPLETDVLNTNRNTMLALHALIAATFGSNTLFDGLGISQTTVASMTVNIGQGSMLSIQTEDGSAYGSLGSDTTDSIFKHGINIVATPLTLTAPGAAGQSQNYLIQANFSEADAGPVVLPYYNAATPAVPFNGPAGAGTSQNTVRQQRVALQLVAGAAAATGSQTTPAVTAGWTALYAITVTNGQTSITSALLGTGNPYTNALIPTAPFINGKLTAFIPRRVPVPTVISTTGAFSFAVPYGINQIKFRAVGAGAAGSGGTVGQGGAGGGAGGGGYKTLAVAPGQVITGSVGAAGAGGTTGVAGGAGGNTTIVVAGTTYTAFGGGAPSVGVNSAGGAGGLATGFDETFQGGYGGDALSGVSTNAGYGGSSMYGGGGRGASGGGTSANGTAPGSGGGGSYNTASTGGTGANGQVAIEY